MEMSKAIIAGIVLALVALTSAVKYREDEVAAYHFHTYIFDINPEHTAEALAFRKRTRELIRDGSLPECSLNQLFVGWDGPHPFSQYELCCNKTSFAAASSFHIQNHGNLSVLIHPLTVYDMDDHVTGATWIGHPVPLNVDCWGAERPCLYPELPKPRPCPVYPEYSDEMPTSRDLLLPPIPGTEDYRDINKHNLMDGKY